MANKKILIVDDDPDVRQGTHIRLKANGFDTCFAADALSAVSEACKQNPDLILLDLGLPAGDGFSVMERLKGIPALALVPIIVISGRDIEANLERAVKAGAMTFLQKPVDNAELMATIRRALGDPPRKKTVRDEDLKLHTDPPRDVSR